MCEEERLLRRRVENEQSYFKATVKAQDRRRVELASYVTEAMMELVRYECMIESIVKLCKTGK